MLNFPLYDPSLGYGDVQQTARDAANATMSDKAAEATNKVVAEGKTEFTQICSKVDIIAASDRANEAAGEAILVNSVTNERIGDIALAADGAENITRLEEASGIESRTATSIDTNSIKVILRYSAPARGDGFEDEVILAAMPTIREDRSASYDTQMTPVHHPGDILKYKSTSARGWGIQAKLISRTTQEAELNVKYLNLIRSWVMPFYGEGTKVNYAAELGAPPPIISLSAYGPLVINSVPCVVESYSTDFPNDCDYVTDTRGNMIPVIMSISINLKESYSPAEYSGFDLKEYRRGNLAGSFSKISVAATGAGQ